MNIKKEIKEKIDTRIIKPFWAYLRQGVTPEKLSITIALGLVLGAFPIIGVTTALCAFAAIIFRLNIAVLQFVNYISYPVQIILLIPFYKLGAAIFRDQPFTVTIDEFKSKITSNFLSTIIEIWNATWHAIIAWAIIAPFAIGLIYFTVFPLLIKINKKKTMP